MPSQYEMTKILKAVMTNGDGSPITTDYLGNQITIENDPHFIDFSSLGAFLSHPSFLSEIRDSLKMLEAAMTDEIGGRWIFSNKHTSAIQYFQKNTNRSAKSMNFHKLLTKALGKFEGVHGFTVPDKLPTFAGFVYGNVFKETIGNGMHFKDIGAGQTHGEFTHRIQWYAAVNAGALQTVEKNEAGRVYKAIARWLNKRRTTAEGARGPLIQLWTYLFDMNATSADEGGGLEVSDLRSPENFHNWLTGGADPDFCPLLRAFLRNRKEKRGAYMIEDYFKKKFGAKRGAEVFEAFNDGTAKNERPSARIVFKEGKAPVYAPNRGDGPG
ncbi:MAG: LirA/MavJ family T4SS effector [Pseudomonadota bacterium]